MKTKTPLNKFRDDSYRGTTLVIAHLRLEHPVKVLKDMLQPSDRLVTAVNGAIRRALPALRNQLSAGPTPGFSQPLALPARESVLC
ncbi:hypothetical protein [Paenibacillus apii]|uniref:hypothetical protein n=1 Tax=Paenibacillus apii TaxID=1850370 RepID=UPI0014397983|nr:hypothetical protein [Paenibacillus apii]NJJ40069.1 hypothetical protein [Paenibacillus apii]